ncbi:MAG TPA: hypothetical protein VFN72_07170 [Solirubrobacterales bacterium]|nr:hypothetical protein [Solirubrobacterales bacterium]
MKLWKVQKFAGDVVYDLRNRNLLLIVVALLVALIAVPVLITRGGSSGPALSTGFGTADSSSPETESAVVAYQPGIRNYKQRLKHLSAKNPFAQQYTSAPNSSNSDPLSQIFSDSSTSGPTGVGGGTTGGGGTGDGGTGGSGGGKSPGKVTEPKTSYFWWESDIQVGESGGELTTMNNVKPFQFLPAADTPVLTYIGTVSQSQAVFLVSKDVVSVGGEGTCFPSVDACQLLGLDGGKGADLIYGPNGKTYHVQVLRVRRVTSSKPPNF